MKKSTKLVAFVTAITAMLNISGVLVPTHAQETPNIVVIGDSISTGAGLPDGEKSYVQLIQDYTCLEIQNFAQDNYTTEDILLSINDAQIQEALSQADVIIVTVGIHDIMDEFISTANEFMTQFGFENFLDVFTASLTDYGFSDEMQLIPYSNKMASAIKANRESATANFQAITENLSQYQNATIVYQTVYNLLDNIENYDNLSVKRKAAYNSILNPAGLAVKSCFNDYLETFTKEQANCILIDAYSAFQGEAYRYTNLNNLEMNPSAEGHAWIAEAIISAAELPEGEKIDDTTPTETNPVPTNPAETTTTVSDLDTTPTETTTTVSDLDTTPTETSTTSSSNTTPTETTTIVSDLDTTPTETSTTSDFNTTPIETTTTVSDLNTTPTETSTTSSFNTTPTETTTTVSDLNTDPPETTTTSDSKPTETSTTSSFNTDPTETSTTNVNNFLLGDANGDGVVDAEDATLVLRHSANVGAKLEDVLTKEQQKRTDVNEDDILDAEDATQILIYSAFEGAGEKYEFVKKDKSEVTDVIPEYTTEPEVVDADPTAPIIS
ncbi:MAG: hypothetical protein HDT22_03280 [Ruminococcus sp.]|nr:hypothetical protein [Ruminococcus sp.]